MAQMSVPGGKTVYTAQYKDFKGVDFSRSDEICDGARFPEADNLMFDKAGYPEKRYGYRCLAEKLGEIHSMKSVTINDESMMLIHAGSSLYKYADGGVYKAERTVKRYSCIISTKAWSSSEAAAIKQRWQSINFYRNGSSEKSKKPLKFGNVIFLALGGYPVSFRPTKEVLDSMTYEEIEAKYAELRMTEAAYIKSVSGAERLYLNLIKNGDFFNGFEGWLTEGVPNYDVCGNFCRIWLDENDASGYRTVFQRNYNSFPTMVSEAYYLSFEAECEDDDGIYCFVNDNTIYTDASGAELHKTVRTDITKAHCISTAAKTPGIGGARSTIQCFNNAAWIITDGGIYRYDGVGVEEALPGAYVPTTSVMRNVHTIVAAGMETLTWNDYGSVYEEKNLLTKKRRNTFALTDFVTNHIPSDSTSCSSTLTLDTNATKIERVEVLTGPGVWTTVDPGWYVMSDSLRVKIDGCKEDVLSGVSYALHPPAPYIYDGITENVRITFTTNAFDTLIDGCGISVMYGIGKDDRLFVTGNKKYPHYVWYSDMARLSYFPDINYAVIGNGDTKILGFGKVNRNLLIHKEGNEQDTTLFMMSGTLESGGAAVFTVEQGINGVGGVSERGFGNFDDIPLFVAEGGVYSVDSTNIISEKTVINRSAYINAVFCEHNLKKAACVTFKDMFIVAVDNYCYILYPRRQSYYGAENVSYQASYEAMRWSGIPAVLLNVFGGELYFGTDDGRLCKFNTDINDMTKYNDYPTLSMETEYAKAVTAYFMTRLDDDGSFMTLKTMIKRGCGIMIKPYAQSGVKVYTLTESEHARKILEKGAAVFDFDTVYFDVVDFSTRDTARIIPFNTKVKKYAALQFKVVNDALSQGFGVFGIEKRYTVGNYKKY